MSDPENVSHDSDPHSDPLISLEVILQRDHELLEKLTQSVTPLTVDTLMLLDPRLGQIAAETQATEIKWPDDDSSVVPAPDARIRRFSGENANQEFIRPALTNGIIEYNNFFLRIGTVHTYPSHAVLQDYFNNADDLTLLAYGTKVYVERAHKLFPEFMSELQKATAEAGGMTSWLETLCLGHFDPDEYPDKRVLLDATRYAYVLLGQLLRQDDYEIQRSLLQMQGESLSPITDPDVELRS